MSDPAVAPHELPQLPDGPMPAAPSQEPNGWFLPERRARIGKRLAILGLIALPFLAFHWLEAPMCASAGNWGVPCPGCGLTRASLALLSGDFSAALHFHPLVPALLPAYVYLVVRVLGAYVLDWKPPEATRQRALIGAIGGVLIVATFAVWLARFQGYFGGPVPVETWDGWSHRKFPGWSGPGKKAAAPSTDS